MSKICAILAVRMDSKRLYGKPLCKIQGKPIVGHLIDIFRKVSEIDDIILATSEKEENKIFADYSNENNMLCYVDRGYDEEDVLGRLIRAADNFQVDQVVRATSEQPIQYDNISKVIKHHLKYNADITFTEKLPIGTNFEIIKLDAMKKAYSFDKKYHCASVSLCMYEHPELFKIEIITPPKKIQRPEIPLDVDTPKNLSALRAIFRDVDKDKNGFVRLEDAIDYVDKNPKILQMLLDGTKSGSRIWN